MRSTRQQEAGAAATDVGASGGGSGGIGTGSAGEGGAPEAPSLHADGIELEIAGVAVRVGADAKPRTIEAVIRALKASA